MALEDTLVMQCLQLALPYRRQRSACFLLLRICILPAFKKRNNLLKSDSMQHTHCIIFAFVYYSIMHHSYTFPYSLHHLFLPALHFVKQIDQRAHNSGFPGAVKLNCPGGLAQEPCMYWCQCVFMF